MARRKKGRNVHGWLVLDKPAGLTSTALVNKARWALGAKKAGHSGTLDPAATGVLAIAFGEATKTIPFVTDAMKAYRFEVRWGVSTNTDDAEGEAIAQSDLRPDEASIQGALAAFTGDIMQVPPQFSAVKINGERAYAKARDGEEMELSARPLFVESLELVEMPDADRAVFEMVCGKGGYVRSIARDLGQTLGCLGHVVSLRRVWSGPFTLEDAHSADILESGPNNADLDAYLLPLEAGLHDLDEQAIRPEALGPLQHGNAARVAYSDLEFGDQCWASLDGQAVAICTYRAGMLTPSKVFVYGDD